MKRKTQTFKKNLLTYKGDNKILYLTGAPFKKVKMKIWNPKFVPLSLSSGFLIIVTWPYYEVKKICFKDKLYTKLSYRYITALCAKIFSPNSSSVVSPTLPKFAESSSFLSLFLFLGTSSEMRLVPAIGPSSTTEVAFCNERKYYYLLLFFLFLKIFDPSKLNLSSSKQFKSWTSKHNF